MKSECFRGQIRAHKIKYTKSQRQIFYDIYHDVCLYVQILMVKTLFNSKNTENRSIVPKAKNEFGSSEFNKKSNY